MDQPNIQVNSMICLSINSSCAILEAWEKEWCKPIWVDEWDIILHPICEKLLEAFCQASSCETQNCSIELMFVDSTFRYSGWRYRKKLHQTSNSCMSFGLNWYLHIFFGFVSTANLCNLHPEIFLYLYPMHLCNLDPEIFVFFKCMNLCNLCPRTSSQHLYPELFCICIWASLHLYPEIFATFVSGSFFVFVS